MDRRCPSPFADEQTEGARLLGAMMPVEWRLGVRIPLQSGQRVVRLGRGLGCALGGTPNVSLQAWGMCPPRGLGRSREAQAPFACDGEGCSPDASGLEEGQPLRQRPHVCVCGGNRHKNLPVTQGYSCPCPGAPGACVPLWVGIAEGCEHKALRQIGIWQGDTCPLWPISPSSPLVQHSPQPLLPFSLLFPIPSPYPYSRLLK